jgi:hypothetical protein
MPDDIPDDDQQAADEPGWRVLAPDGTVLASGPGIVLEMATHIGEEQ